MSREVGAKGNGRDQPARKPGEKPQRAAAEDTAGAAQADLGLPRTPHSPDAIKRVFQEGVYP